MHFLVALSGAREPAGSRTPAALLPLRLLLRLLPCLGLALLAGLPLQAQQDPLSGTSQRQALAFEAATVETTRQVIDGLLREFEPAQQFDWSVRLRPSVLYREYLDGRPDVLVSPRAGLIVQLRFGEQPVASVRRLIRLERAFAAHARAGRMGIRSALLAHGELLLQQDAAAKALAALELLEQGDADDSETGRLRLAAAELAWRQASHALEQARTDALAHGLASGASYESLRFVLPPADSPAAEDTSGWRILQLQAAEARALVQQATTRDPLNDLRVGAGYRTSGLDLDLEGGLLAGRPGLRFAATTPGGRERFEVRASLELLLDQKVAGIAGLQAAVADAEAALLAYPREFRLGVEAARAEALFAAEALQLVETELALADSERAAAQLRVRKWRAWLTYVRRTADLLEVTGADWQWQ
jgi:hypothetical protein